MTTRTEPTAFKSTTPAVFDWWEQAQTARREFNERVAEFEAQYGMGRKAVVLADFPDGPPEGWRIVESKHGFSWIQPYRRAKWQKDIHDAMPEMAEARESMPGFEHHIFGELPGFFIHDGAAYATIGNAEQMDADVWEPIALSEFYAAREAHEAEAAEVSA